MIQPEAELRRICEGLIEEQGEIVLASFDRIDSAEALDADAIPFDVETWGDRYAEECEVQFLDLLFRGWQDGEEALAEVQGKGYDRAARRKYSYEVFDAEILSWAQQYVRHFGERVNRNFAKALTRSVADMLAEGATLREVRDGIEAKYFHGAPRRYRADTIARTESVRARRGGANQQWRQSGVVQAKFWKAIPATDWPCEFCAAMDGQRIGLEDEYFPLGGQMELPNGHRLQFSYEGVEHPPLHPRCRCTEVPELVE